MRGVQSEWMTGAGLGLVLLFASTACGGPEEELGLDQSSVVGDGSGEGGGGGGTAGAKIVGCGLSSSGFAYAYSRSVPITSGLNPTVQKLYGGDNDWYRFTVPAGFCVHHRILFRRSSITSAMPSDISCAMYWDTSSALAGTPTHCGIVDGSPRICGVQFTTYEAQPREVIIALSRSDTSALAASYQVQYVGSVPCHEDTSDPYAPYDGGQFSFLNP